jgi:carboxyl-terminal processing protease
MTKSKPGTACILVCLAFPFGGMAKEASIGAQAYMIVRTAEKYHYAPKPVNDRFSEEVYKSFFHMLDPYGIVFTDESIRKLDGFKTALDDQILQQKTTFLDSATSLYVQQLHAADSLLQKLKNSEIDRPIDLSVNDTLWLGGDAVYAKQCLLPKKTEQWIKYLVLWSFQTGSEPSNEWGPPAEKETHKILDDVFTRETCRIRSKMDPPGGIKGFTGLQYLKAISNAFDPHTEYLSCAENKLFEDHLLKESGSFGMRIDFNAIGEAEIVEMLPGGPSWRSNKINEGDVILDIKNHDGASIDLRCATLSDVHSFLSSIGNNKAGFTIRKKSGKIIEVPLKKEILDAEDNTVRSYILKGNVSIGYLYLPSFYIDFTYANYFSKGCANDLAKELIKLKNSSIDGLLLDVRSNGGGSLNEAIRAAGEFIDFGALCITHFRGKDPETVKDNARGTIYSGPLVVLANSSSASASELLLGVLHDYRRAVIVGSRTYGKSTIQEDLPVDACDFDSLSHYKGDPPGYLTLTIGSYYRVNGTNHQKVGITPDIELPELFRNAQDREALYDNALEFGTINKKTYYYPLDSLPVKKLKRLSDARLKNNAVFNYMIKIESLIPNTNSRYPVPLTVKHFNEYIGRFYELEDSVTVKNCPFTAMLPENGKSRSSMTGQDKADNDAIMADLQEDAYVNEAFAVINDLVNSPKTKEGR